MWCLPVSWSSAPVVWWCGGWVSLDCGESSMGGKVHLKREKCKSLFIDMFG